MSDGETWKCNNCGKDCTPTATGEISAPCVNCGSIARTIHVTFEDTIEVTDWLDLRGGNTKMTGKRKMRRHLQTGMQWSFAREKFVEKVRDLDRDADTYFERVTDPDTGEMIRHCDEPLSEHLGRGSATSKGG